jgi:hypothetical protein
VRLAHDVHLSRLFEAERGILANRLQQPVTADAAGGLLDHADCTGEMELDIPGSPFTPVILRLSVGANGAHINTVVSKAGYVVSSTGTRVDEDDRD